MWAVLDSPFSRFAEAIRAIKLAVDLNGDVVNANKVIGVTSSIPNEGKSTIAASLALLMAQVGARVILVDCDLRNPTLSRKLAPNADCGLLDVIVGTTAIGGCSMDGCIHQLGVLARRHKKSPYQFK